MEYAIQTKKRKGNFVGHFVKDYLKFGFIAAPGGELSPWHLHSKHRNFINKPLDFFQREHDQMKS